MTSKRLIEWIALRGYGVIDRLIRHARRGIREREVLRGGAPAVNARKTFSIKRAAQKVRLVNDRTTWTVKREPSFVVP